MNKSGLVVDSNNKYACLLSCDGQFINVAIKERVPLKGEIYAGEVYKKAPIYRLPLMAAIITFIVFLSGGFYTYYTPAAEVTISINPAVKLNLNLWHKIIESVPLNKDGEKLLSSLQLRNKDLNTGLDLIVKQAKIDNFINEAYVDNEKVISVEIIKNKSPKLNLSRFQKSVKAQNLKIQIIDETKSKPDSKKSDSKGTLKEEEDNKSNKIKKNKDAKPVKKEDTDKNNNSDSTDNDDTKNKTNKDTKKPVDNNSNTGNNDKKEKDYPNNDKNKVKKQTSNIKAFNKNNRNKVHSTGNSKVKSYNGIFTKSDKDKDSDKGLK